MRNALLTYDHIEYIVPFDWYRPDEEDGPEMAMAIEMIGRRRVPNDREKKKSMASS